MSKVFQKSWDGMSSPSLTSRSRLARFQLTNCIRSQTQGRIAEYQISEVQSGGNGDQRKAPIRFRHDHGKANSLAPHHRWLTNKTNAPAAINTAFKIPTTNEITGCRLRLTSSDPAPFCATPRPNQKRSLSIDLAGAANKAEISQPISNQAHVWQSSSAATEARTQ